MSSDPYGLPGGGVERASGNTPLAVTIGVVLVAILVGTLFYATRTPADRVPTSMADLATGRPSVYEFATDS